MSSSGSSLKMLLDHIGVETTNEHDLLNADTLSYLMNFTLHCLGGVRQILHLMEKERLAKLAVGDENSSNIPALREVFTQAAMEILEAANTGVQINDLDPARHLIESFPDEHKFNDKRWLKLQWAIVCHSKLTNVQDTLSTLVNHDKESIRELDKEGRSILHYASRLDDVELIRTVAKLSDTSQNGYGPKFANHNGALPLHNVARFGKSFPVYLNVLNLYPQAIRVPNEAGTLPLHWAAAKNSNLEIIKHIIQSYPEAITIPNNEGCLPLHTAGQNTNLEIVKTIYDTYPQAICMVDHEGGYPFHHACCMNSNIDVIQFFYNVFPDAISSPQSDGVLPLHFSAFRNSSPEIMQFLLGKYPQATKKPDSVGWLPLHCLVNNSPIDMRQNRITCLKLLLSTYPEAVRYQNQERKTPYDMARERGHHSHIIRLLLLAHPSTDITHLRELNWQARKYAVMLLIQHTQICKHVFHYISPCDAHTLFSSTTADNNTTTTSNSSSTTQSISHYTTTTGSSAMSLSNSPKQDVSGVKYRKVSITGKGVHSIDDVGQETRSISHISTPTHASVTFSTTTTSAAAAAVGNSTVSNDTSVIGRKRLGSHGNLDMEYKVNTNNGLPSPQSTTNGVHTEEETKKLSLLFCRLARLDKISPEGKIENEILRHIIRYL